MTARTASPRLALALALGCSPAEGRLVDATPPADTGGLSSVDTGADGAAPAPDLTIWQGTRTFRIDTDWDDYDCEDAVEESGGPPADPERHAELAAACPECTHLYEVALSTDMVCGYLPLDPSPWRGLVLDAGATRVLRFREARGGGMQAVELDPAATFDGWSVRYAYGVADGWIEAVEVAGHITFPDAEARP